MAFIPDSVIRSTKTVANVAAVVTTATKSILELLTPQNKNIFQILLYPQSPDPGETDPTSVATRVAFGILDTTVSTFFIQSLDIPMLGFEYVEYNERKGISNLVYPEEITVTFIENEVGVVRNYLDYWLSTIVQSDYGDSDGYTFKDNQNVSKKEALIMPMDGLAIPTIGWIKIRGMKYKGMENWSFAQNDGDPMIITATFSVDNVWIYNGI